MCIIIEKPANFTVPLAWVNEFWANNPDGFGVVWHSEEKVKAFKTLEKDGAIRFLKGLHDKAAIIHFRQATHGIVSEAMCHPFEIMPGFYLIHNGIIDAPECDKDESDTFAFTMQVIKPLLEDSVNPHWLIRSEAFRFLVESHAGKSNRLVISDDYGNVIYNTNIWHKITKGRLKGIRVSNTYAWDNIDVPSVKPAALGWPSKSVGYTAPKITPATSVFNVPALAQEYGDFALKDEDDLPTDEALIFADADALWLADENAVRDYVFSHPGAAAQLLYYYCNNKI